MDFVRKNIAIILIIAIGFILRFSISIIHSYSSDELSSITRLELFSGEDFFEEGVKVGDMHPAGVQVFLKAWSSVFGTSEGFLRFPFVVFGSLSIWLLYLLGNRWFDKRTAIIASGFIAFLYFPILNSEFARPYSIGLLLTLLTVYFWQKVLFNQEKKLLNAIVLGLCFAASMYVHYFQFIVVASIGVIGLFYINRTNYKYYILGSVIGIILFIPHIPITIYHLNVGGLQWLAPPGYSWFFEFIFHVFNSSWWVLGLVIVLLIIGLYNKKAVESIQNRQEFIPIAIFILTFLIGFLLSYIVTPVLKFPVMLFVLPFLFLVIAKFISRIPSFKIVLVVLFTGIILSTVFEKQLYGNNHFGLFKETSDIIIDWEKTYGSDNIYKIVNTSNGSYLNFYAEQRGEHIDFDWTALDYGDVPAIRKALLNIDEDYCVVGYSARHTLPQLYETVKEFYPNIIAGYVFNNSAIFLLGKGASNTEQNLLAEFSLSGDLRGNWVFDKGNVKTNQEGASVYLLADDVIYGPEYVFKLTDIPSISDYYIKVVVEADIESEGQLTAAFSANRGGAVVQFNGENYWKGFDLEPALLTNKSKQGIFVFMVEPIFKQTDELKLSLWNRNGLKVEIENIKVYLVKNNWN